jgi:hypothetical protein
MTRPFPRYRDLTGPDRLPVLAVVLALLAGLPLWLVAIAVIAPVAAIDARQALAAGLAWAGLLVAFGGGLRWGIALGPLGGARRARDFVAAAGFVAVAAGVFLAPPVVGLALALAGFLMQALFDVTAGDEGRIPGWWVRVRLLATGLLVLPVLALMVRISLGGP